MSRQIDEAFKRRIGIVAFLATKPGYVLTTDICLGIGLTTSNHDRSKVTYAMKGLVKGGVVLKRYNYSRTRQSTYRYLPIG